MIMSDMNLDQELYFEIDTEVYSDEDIEYINDMILKFFKQANRWIEFPAHGIAACFVLNDDERDHKLIKRMNLIGWDVKVEKRNETTLIVSVSVDSIFPNRKIKNFV